MFVFKMNLVDWKMKMTIPHETAVKRLAELGHSTRLAVFRLLIKAGHPGMAVGDLQRMLAVPGSTLSHHISRLMAAGLVSQERQGRVLICRAEFDALKQLIDFLNEECCVGVDSILTQIEVE
jgi:ArsR family transcriptional regulator, arsenate/arsenite/antimonite-responsive transcriptional repressor